MIQRRHHYRLLSLSFDNSSNHQNWCPFSIMNIWNVGVSLFSLMFELSLRLRLLLILLILASTSTNHNVTTTTTTMAFSWFPLPPWRGTRQLMAIGPWGDLLDVKKSKEVLWISPTNNRTGSTSTSTTTTTTSQVIHSSKLPPCPPNHRRIVATSDTHGKHRFVHVPKCDIFIHCGDILQRYGYIGDLGGGIPTLLDFASWLQSPKYVPAKYAAIVIAGNHDRLLEKLGPTRIQSILNRMKKHQQQKQQHQQKKCFYLQNEAIQVCDLILYGSPWSPKGNTGNLAFQEGSNAFAAVQLALSNTAADGDDDDDDNNNIDAGTLSYSSDTTTTTTTTTNLLSLEDIDILMTHASCKTWEEFIQMKNTNLWVHGHWHDGQGKIRNIRNKYKDKNRNNKDDDDDKDKMNGRISSPQPSYTTTTTTTTPSSSFCVSVNVASNDMIYRPRNPPIVMDVPIRRRKNY